MDWKKVGERVKYLESLNEHSIASEKCFIIRLDGCSFSTFTKGMKRPFDARFTQAMMDTTVDLLKKYNCRTGFTQSDEITLYFPPCDLDKGQTHLYGGRVEKLCSIIASYTSVRFNHHIKRFEWEEKLTSNGGGSRIR
jgi:tRNA(His) guanylyltransferase